MVGWLPNPKGIVSFSPALDDASRPTLGRQAEMNTTLKGLNPFRVRRPRDSRMVDLASRCVARPRIECGGQHELVFQRQTDRQRDAFKRRKPVGHGAGGNDDFTFGARESGWPPKARHMIGFEILATQS